MKLTSLVLLFCCAWSTAFAQTDYVWHSRLLRGSPHYDSDVHGGSFVQRADGKMLVTYRIDDRAMLSVVDSEEKLLTTANASRANEHSIYNFYAKPDASRTALQKLTNGRILLYIVETGISNSESNPFRISVLESRNGLGTDFKLKSTIYTKILQSNVFGDMGMGNPVQMKGHILIPMTLPVPDSGFKDVDTGRLYCAISSDGGASWTFSQIATDSWYRGTSRSFGMAKDQIFVLVQKGYAAGTTTVFSHSLGDLAGSTIIGDNIPVWTAHDPYQQNAIGDMVFSHIFFGGDGYTYFLRDAGFEGSISTQYFVYRRPSARVMDFSGQTPYSLGPPGSGAAWEGPLTARAYGDDGTEFFSVTPSGSLTFYGTSYFGGGSISHMYVGTPKAH